MPKVKVNDITMNYERQGTGEPLILIPYLAADNACYAFQVADYAKRFDCISVDPRGAGESDKPVGPYSTQLFADDVAAFMQAIGVERAHVSGLSLGAATGLWLASKYPNRVKSLSLHSCWTRSDPFLKTVVEGWQTIAKGLGSVTEMIIQGIFPWCFTPELYAAKPDYIDQLAYGPDAGDFRPPRPGDVDPLRRRAPKRNQGQRTRGVRDLLARADLRERGRVQREDARLSRATYRVGIGAIPDGREAADRDSSVASTVA
jgi:pimeloyl-ACP methyl ester carboxylesterase